MPEPLFGGDASFSFACALRAKIKRHQPLDILLVEDDPSDAALTGYALDETRVPYRLQVLQDGEHVVPYLNRQGVYCDALLPDLIMLDLNLPIKTGFEVLSEMTRLAGSYAIPIVILSGTQDYHDVLKAYGLWLCGYLPKPCDSTQLLETFGRLHSPRM